MDGMMGLTAAEQRELDQRLQRKQMSEFADAFASLVSHCFDSCVDDFTTKSLVSREQGCVSRCVQKFMAGQERISQRYGELNMQMMNQQNGSR